ncbi:MAG TPA: fatty acid desaturase [Allosphingosinicella sp.]
MSFQLHVRKTLFLLGETAAIFLSLAGLTLAALTRLPPAAAWPVIALLAFMQGLWFDRLYTVAHEAVHHKLAPGRRRLNDAIGIVLMLPLLAPFAVFRKIHGFHHGGNRRDPETAALDHMRLPPDAGPKQIAARRRLWFFYVFAGGFYLHTLATILIFLLVPSNRAVRISPVFRAWPARLRVQAWLHFGAGILLHLAVGRILGGAAWFALLGLPMLVFAWFWSMMLYIYHHRTSVGPDVRHNVRSLPRQPFFSWLLLNFNEHSTHHRDPGIPWYELPERRYQLPPSHAANQDVSTLFEAVVRQREGPVLWTPR